MIRTRSCGLDSYSRSFRPHNHPFPSRDSQAQRGTAPCPVSPSKEYESTEAPLHLASGWKRVAPSLPRKDPSPLLPPSTHPEPCIFLPLWGKPCPRGQHSWATPALGQGSACHLSNAYIFQPLSSQPQGIQLALDGTPQPRWVASLEVVERSLACFPACSQQLGKAGGSPAHLPCTSRTEGVSGQQLL